MDRHGYSLSLKNIFNLITFTYRISTTLVEYTLN